MSSVVISGDTSGAITLASPAVAGTNTATLPAATGTVMVSGNMPAFSAYSSSGTVVPSVTNTKMLFQTEEYDTNNNFASSRFTPTIAGYYMINACVYPGSASRTGEVSMILFKNGVQTKYGFDTLTSFPFYILSSSWQIYLNGTTDYVEIYVFAVNGSTFNTGSDVNYISGSMIRSA